MAAKKQKRKGAKRTPASNTTLSPIVGGEGSTGTGTPTGGDNVIVPKEELLLEGKEKITRPYYETARGAVEQADVEQTLMYGLYEPNRAAVGKRADKYKSDEARNILPEMPELDEDSRERRRRLAQRSAKRRGRASTIMTQETLG